MGVFSNSLLRDAATSRNADIGQQGFAAQFAAGQQQMPRLQTEEGDGERRLHRRPSTFPLSPSSPLGTSTAITGTWLRFIASARRRDRICPRPRQAGAEQGIHDQGRAVQRRRRERTRAPCHCPAIAAASPLWPSPRRHHTSKPCAARSRAATKPSPPLLPGPHSTGPCGRKARGNGFGHRPSGILHQGERGRARLDGGSVGAPHLIIGKNFSPAIRQSRAGVSIRMRIDTFVGLGSLEHAPFVERLAHDLQSHRQAVDITARHAGRRLLGED